MKKLNFLGVGPRIATVLLPWLAATIIISIWKKGLFTYSDNRRPVIIAGVILMAAALGFYFSTVRLLLKGLTETKLMTNGPYGLCQNPLYASICLFILPALSLIMNSWLVLTSSLIGYIMFKIFIKHEYNELEKFFGQQYLDYKNRTPEFFPVPFLKRK